MLYDGTVLVLGATGQTGERVVRRLVDKGIKVRILVRNLQKAEAFKAHGVDIRVGDLMNEADLRSAFQGVHAVISALGTTPNNTPQEMEAIEYRLIETLERLGAEFQLDQIVICSSMGTETPDALPFIASVLRHKRRGEQALEAGRVPYTIVRPGGLLNEPGGQEIGVARTHHVGGRISRDDVAEVLVQALLQPEARNKIVEVINQAGAGRADRPHLFA